MERPPSPPGYGRRFLDLLGTPGGRWLARVLGAAVVLVLVGSVVRQARAYAYRLPCHRLGPGSIRFVDLDRDLGPGVVEALVDPGVLRFEVSLFDPRAEDLVRDAVARHPMVAAVRGVEVVWPNRALVRVALRHPAAWFRVPDGKGGFGFVLVSTDARRLDPAPYADLLRRLRVPLPVVIGTRAQHPDWPGQAWEDLPEQVAEGIAAAGVAAALHRDLRGRAYVETIDVTDFPALPEHRQRGEVRLRLDDGAIVEWGRTDRAGKGVAGEDSYATKLRRLESALASRGSPGKRRVDVRYPLPEEGRAAAPSR